MKKVEMMTNPPSNALLVLESWEVPKSLRVACQFLQFTILMRVVEHDPHIWFGLLGSWSKFSAKSVMVKLRTSVLVQTEVVESLNMMTMI